MSARDRRPIQRWRDPPGSRVGLMLVRAYLTEVAPDDYRLTTAKSEATHGLIDTTSDGDWEITPLAALDGSVRLVRVRADTYRGY